MYQITIARKYILNNLLRNFFLSLGLFCTLFLIIDFFDRIDNIVSAKGSFSSAFQYFIFKIPLTASLMAPLALLVATLFTYGMMSKNAELTAMRSAGLSIYQLSHPLILVGLLLSSFVLLLNESIVPICTRRVKEIYNLDIQKKDQSGSYSQSDFWWRKGSKLMFINDFDSRTNSMLGVSIFDLGDEFSVLRRFDARMGHWIDSMLGWTLKDITERHFKGENISDQQSIPSLPLAMTDGPEEFYDVKTEPDTMSYRELKRYIKKQLESGISIRNYEADLYAKIAFPFIGLVISFVALPFALKPARSGSMAISFLAGLTIGFSYYVFHSISMSLGHAELIPPFFAAWSANLFMIAVGVVLNLGAEAPL